MIASKVFGAAALASVLVAGAASAQTVQYRPLTVAPHHAPHYYAPPPAYNPYNPYAGPAAVITAPVHFAGTLASLPFHAINSVFPPQRTPLAVVGAPVYVAGRIVETPFRIVEAPFGGPSPFAEY